MSKFDEEVSIMIKDCETRQDRMSDWEQEFIDSIDQRLGAGRDLTPRQYEILERIWEKVTTRG